MKSIILKNIYQNIKKTQICDVGIYVLFWPVC